MSDPAMSLEILKRLPDPEWTSFREGIYGSGPYKNFEDFSTNLLMVASQRKFKRGRCIFRCGQKEVREEGTQETDLQILPHQGWMQIQRPVQI
jgi:hypothetical protein